MTLTVPPSLPAAAAAAAPAQVAPPWLPWLLTLVVPVGVHALAARQLPASAALLLALMAGAAVQWAFRVVPDFVVGLLVLWLCVLLDLAPATLVFSGFTSPVFLLVLGIFLLSTLLADSPWIGRGVQALLRHTGACRACRFAALAMATALLTLMLPSPVGRSAVLAPLLRPLAARGNARENTALVVTLVHANTLWSTAVLTGNPLNFVLLGLLDTQAQQRFQWAGWCEAAAAYLLVSAAGLAVLVGWVLHRAPATVAPKEPLPLHAGPPAYAGLQHPAPWHGTVPVLYGLLAVGVLTPSLHQMELHVVAGALALAGHCLAPVPLGTLRSRLDWPTLLFIASLAAWQPLLTHAGVSRWLETALAQGLSSLQALPLPVDTTVLLLAVLVALVRLLMPGGPAFIVLAAGLLPLAPTLGMAPWVLGFVLLTLTEGFLLPHQHGVPSHLEAEALAQGVALDRHRLHQAHAAAWAVRVLALLASAPWWHHLSIT